MDRLEILDIELENLVSEKHKTLDLMDTITKDLLDLELLIASIDEKIEKNKLEQSTLINYEKINNEEDMISQDNLEEMIKDKKEKQTKLVNFFIENSSDEEKLQNVDLFVEWNAKVYYETGNVVRYNDDLYRVLQNHQAQPDYSPDLAVSLFVKIGGTDVETGLQELEPSPNNLYKAGDIGVFDSKVWKSKYDDNGNPVDTENGWWEYLGTVEEYKQDDSIIN